jgi:predicted nucleic acid-binding protein
VLSVTRGEVDAIAPDLIWTETANVLARYVRRRLLTPRVAAQGFARLRALPLVVHPVESFVDTVLAAAIRHRLSAYDACYLVLAEASGATLVTSDVVLARASRRGELLPA